MRVPGVQVVLHQVGRRRQGPLDSVTADHSGRFRFRFRADTSAIYLLSARYQTIEYFSRPVHINPARPDTGIILSVYDTSSRAPVDIEARHLVVSRPGDDGSRAVLDLFLLRIRGVLARVAPDTLHPSWSAALPAGTVGFDVGESDFSPEAVSRRDDTVVVVAPVAPGEKQLAIQYLIPPGLADVGVPLGAAPTRLDVLIEERGIGVRAPGLAYADTQTIEGRLFHRWTGTVPANAVVRLELPRVPRDSRPLLLALVGGLGAILLLVAWRVLRRDRGTAVPVQPGSLIERIAALDARYQGREAELPPDEWRRYLDDRARLKAELESALARDRAGR